MRQQPGRALLGGGEPVERRAVIEDEILTSEEARRLLKIGRTKLWDLTKKNMIPAYGSARADVGARQSVDSCAGSTTTGSEPRPAEGCDVRTSRRSCQIRRGPFRSTGRCSTTGRSPRWPTFKSGWITTGERTGVRAAIAEYVGASHAVALNSCTARCTSRSRPKGLDPATRSSRPPTRSSPPWKRSATAEPDPCSWTSTRSPATSTPRSSKRRSRPARARSFRSTSRGSRARWIRSSTLRAVTASR